jgi:hypothetical protein
MKFELIRDKPKIDKLLDIILTELNNNSNSKLIKINRICKLTMNIYFKVNNELTIYFKVYSPSQFAIEEMETEKNNQSIK